MVTLSEVVATEVGIWFLRETMKTAVLVTTIVNNSLRRIIVGGRYSMFAGGGDAPGTARRLNGEKVKKGEPKK